MEHAEMIEQVFVDYLNGILPTPWSFDLRIYSGENNLDKDGARIVCYVQGDLGEESPPRSGNRMADVIVELRTPFSKLTDEEKAEGALDPFSAHQSDAAALQTAIMSDSLTRDLQALTSDLCIYDYSNRTPNRAQADNYWQSGWKVQINSVPN